MARLGECELIYANFSNEVTIKPYAVFVDYEKQVKMHILWTIIKHGKWNECDTDNIWWFSCLGHSLQ